MNTLIKSRTIAELASPRTGHPAEFRTDSGRLIEVSTDVYADMGSPSTITVTIEPGDLLNEVESDLPHGAGDDLRPFVERRIDRLADHAGE